MTKQANPNIGHVACGECGELSALRKDTKGKFYYLCLNCGLLKPNHAGGQKRLIDRATVWGAGGAPSDLPAWIRENWSYALCIQSRDKSKPAPKAAPENPANSPGIPDLPTPPPKPSAVEVRAKVGPGKDAPPADVNPKGFSFLED